MRLRIHVPVALALLLLPMSARADGVADEAEADFRMAVARFQTQDYEGALAWFMASNRLAPNSNVQFNIARTFDALSRLPEAHRWYQDALASASTDAARAEIREALDRLERRVAIVVVESNPPGATVYLDRRDLGSIARTPARIAVPPGAHQLLVELPGFVEAAPQSFTGRVSQVERVSFALERIVGRVEVGGEAGTELRVDRDDGEPACTLPCTLQLDPGVHTLRAHREGTRFDPLTVRVEANTSTRVSLEGRARTGSLVVTSDERDAVVEIDGRPVGFTPAVLPNVPIGERRIVVIADGFERLERTVVIEEGEQTELRELRLVPERVVTTASRVEEAYDDSPASLSVVSAHELEAFRFPTVAEALRGLRGVTLTHDTAYTSIAVRGLGQPNDYGNRVLMLQNGTVLNDNILYQSFTGFDGRVDLGDVQRIEFIRGPGSVLYGTGAVSGLVNLISHGGDRPNTADVTISAYGGGVGRGRAHTHLRLPGGGGFDASVSGAYATGRTERLFDPSAGQTVRVEGVDQFTAASTSGRLYAGDFRMQWQYSTRDQAIPTGVYGTAVGRDETFYRDHRAMFEVAYEPELSDKVQLFLRATANLYRFRAAYAYLSDELDPTSPSLVLRETYDGRWMVGEARLVARPVESLQLIAGAEAQVSFRASLRGEEDGTADPYLDTENDYGIFSGYVLGEYSPTRAVKLSAGVRGDFWNTGTVGFTPPYAVSPRLAVIVHPWDGGTIKLMSGRAFRAPSTYELVYTDGGSTQLASPADSLRPESVWSAEAEVGHRFEEDWSVLGAFHFQQAANFIETRPADDDPSTVDDESLLVWYENAAERVRVMGGDLELRKEWRDGWMLSLNYGYLDTRYDALPTSVTGSRRVPNQPRHFGSSRTVVPLGRSGVELALRATLEGARRIGPDSDARTDTTVIFDAVFSGKGWDEHLTWAVGAYDLFGWRRTLPVGDIFPTATLRQPGRSLFAEFRLAY